MFHQIPRIASNYSGIERAELESELAATLLEIRQKPNPLVRDWKAYLAQCLRRRASYLAQRSRKHRACQFSLEVTSPLSDEAREEDISSSVPAPVQRFALFQRGLGNADRQLIRQLEECKANVSLLARRLRCHRNTIHRRLRRITRTRCPTEIESAPTRADLKRAREYAQLEAVIHQSTAPARHLWRAKVVLAVLDGHSYNQITRDLGASASTIARWRQRFAKHGAVGLIARHRGKKPSRARSRLQRWLCDHKRGIRPSMRSLARRFRLGKSTVQRILKTNR